jgi:hypothetical protein
MCGLNEFDLAWRVNGFIVTRNNLVVTWKDRPQMSFFLFPLRLPCFSWVGCILGSLAIEFSIYAKKRKEKKLHVWDFTTFGDSMY